MRFHSFLISTFPPESWPYREAQGLSKSRGVLETWLVSLSRWDTHCGNWTVQCGVRVSSGLAGKHCACSLM